MKDKAGFLKRTDMDNHFKEQRNSKGDSQPLESVFVTIGIIQIIVSIISLIVDILLILMA